MENSSKKVEWEGCDLLQVTASNVARYGRKIGCKNWSEQQIKEHMVSPRKSHGSHCRPAFPESGKKFGSVSEYL